METATIKLERYHKLLDIEKKFKEDCGNIFFWDYRMDSNISVYTKDEALKILIENTAKLEQALREKEIWPPRKEETKPKRTFWSKLF